MVGEVAEAMAVPAADLLFGGYYPADAEGGDQVSISRQNLAAVDAIDSAESQCGGLLLRLAAR